MKHTYQKHNRRSLRLKGYDYSQAGLYFITLNCQNRHHLFGEIQNGIMCLNKFGTIAHENWLKTPSIRSNVRLGAFVIMPDHMHGILQILESKGSKRLVGKFQSPTETIGAIVRGFKGSVTTKIKSATRSWQYRNLPSPDFSKNSKLEIAPGPTAFINLEQKNSIWQRNYDDRIIWNNHNLIRVTNYINDNPTNWKIKQ